MPPSQLKRLKASLRDQGITGPQKSKKQKKQQQKNGADQYAKKAAALASIRESFNPFEVKHLSRPKKFDYATSRPDHGNKVLGRPGVTKSQGEETRRKTLLPEMNRRNKVGGILDRRIGENDPTMDLEERQMARFEREQQRKRGNVFDLEEADEEAELTHGGRSLRFDNDDDDEDDYDAASVEASSDGEDGGFLRKKRPRDDDDEAIDGLEGLVAGDEPDRKKTKAEVMKEVIAKSKLHKHLRQEQKDDDEDLIEKLDKGLPDILAALQGHINKKPEPPKEPPPNDFGINPERAALLAGNPANADKEYDSRVRQLMLDQRAKPTERTKTDEEKATEQVQKLKDLETKRLRRMKGEAESESEDEPREQDQDEDEDFGASDAAAFGLPNQLPDQSHPDEDDFLIDDDLIASDSEADISEEESESDADQDDTMGVDDDDLLQDVLASKSKPSPSSNGRNGVGAAAASSKLAYTYPCPRSHHELLDVFANVPASDIPTVIQRIRALYHAGLASVNKDKLSDFAGALVDHIPYMAAQRPPTPLSVVEQVIRHIHSMARAYPSQIATRFREHLQQLQASNDMSPGMLAVLTAVSTIYPTSDHFHRIVTPSITLMARWMGLTTPSSATDVATGAFVGALCLHYQRLSKRYIPEFIRYTSLCLTSPHTTPALLKSHSKNILSALDLWSHTPALIEIFTPLLTPLKAQSQTATHHRLTIALSNAKLHRRPQLLHNHRPLPIKTQMPKFEESFDPTKHYDPDRERADAAKLRKEYKRERKGALRELRKDANFIAREKLRDKKEKDRAYEDKYRRIVAEIQGEEGRERNEYERERRRRKGGR
ncbi:Nop14-like protein [Polyplosphaeria fusca]|uniref:Nop14-like protein n=1 Tax=Polyplosphaeria fusca TaxID=682080 RepID=A0A9P4UYR3_9PLEO|nr:Nop14-like protein [Polyplosphaeria fusca]